MVYVYKEYVVKIKMVQWQWLQLKWSFYRAIAWKLLFSKGRLTFGEGRGEGGGFEVGGGEE